MAASTWIIILLLIVVFTLIYIAILGYDIINQLSMFRRKFDETFVPKPVESRKNKQLPEETVDQLKIIVNRLDRLIDRTPRRLTD